MKTHTCSFKYTERSEAELSDSEQKLLKAAIEATAGSYSPYSHFRVGAAVLLDDGTIVQGSNQENCAYPNGQCAERTAVFYANSRYPQRSITALCIAACDKNGTFTILPLSPCGACRQVLLESEIRQHSPIKLLLYGTQSVVTVPSVRDLLPLCFDDTFLNT